MQLSDLCGVPAEPDLRLSPEAYAEVADVLYRLRPPPRLDAPALVVPVPVDPRGRLGPTRGQSRGPGWRRTAPNRFVPTDAVLEQPAQRIREAADLLPPLGGVTGWAALRLMGARWFDGVEDGADLPVPLALGPRAQRVDREGIATHRQRIDPDLTRVHHGVACLPVERALLDEVRRRSDPGEAVAAIEMACHAELTSLRRFARVVDAHPRRPDIDLARAALARTREGAESPPEVGLRLLWEEDAGLAPPLVNAEVFSLDGRFLGRPDLLDPVAGVAVEYNGDHHLELRQHRHDLGREEDFRAHGLEVVTAVGGQLRERHALAARITAVRDRALRSTEPRRWTLEAPYGWRAPLTLDERLDLRERLLVLARGEM